MLEEQKIKIAKEIADVRRTGIVNMFSRTGVIEVLESLGHFKTADFLTENKDKYMGLLKLSGNY